MSTEDELQRGRERIQKLLKMTEANGADEHTAANAMRLAAGLAAKLGIELEACRPAGEAKPKPKQQRMSEEKLKPYEAFCAEAAAELYGVECQAHNLGKYGFQYTGREENINLAEDTYLWLVSQVEHFYKEALAARTGPTMTVKQRADFRSSFKDACGKRILERAKTLVREMTTQDQAAMEATGSNALVVMGHFRMLRNEIHDWRNENYEESRRRMEQRQLESQEKRIQMLAGMTEPERVAFLQREEERRQVEKAQAEKFEKEWQRRQRAAERRAEKRGGWAEPKSRSMKVGSGTLAGRSAGDRVQLRKEIK